VPLDQLSWERLSFMLEDAQVPVLTQQRWVESLGALKVQVVCLDTDWEAIAKQSEDNPTSSVTAEQLTSSTPLALQGKPRELLFPQSCKSAGVQH